jgi:predicted MFS family arabinose efflux permease
MSALEKADNADDSDKDANFPEQAVALFRTPGFIPPLAAFVTSIAVTNVVGTFMEQKLVSAGITDHGTIDLSGASFELAIVLGGIVLGGVVDRNKEYKTVTLACLAATLGGVLVFGQSSLPKAAVIIALMAIGLFAGPVQPINAELAVEVTYPADENAIEAVQQLCGNLASALLVPICEWAAGFSSNGMRGDTILLLVIISVVGLYFSTFSAPLVRSQVDGENCLVPSQAVPSKVS